MRIIYTFQKKNGFWIVNCPSDKSVQESSYNSLHEAINKFLFNHKNIEYFDMVIPSIVPTPIQFSKPIRLKKLATEKQKPKTVRRLKYDSKWAVITPPYDKQYILLIHDPFYNRKRHHMKMEDKL